MRTLLNIIWLLLSGIWLALGYVVAGIVMCLLIVTIPFGVQAFKIASFALWPFGREMVPRPGASVGLSLVGNVLWLLLAGWWLALGHIVSAIVLAITIIGLPLAWANLKLVPISLFPFGHEIVPSSQARVWGSY